MKITGSLRDGKEFRFAKKATHAAPSTFTAVTKDEVIVTRHLSSLLKNDDGSP
jgi:hypothetical protein